MPVPYLNNPSEKTIFGSNKIKEQHEAMKSSKWRSFAQKHLKPWLMNWTDQQSVHKRQTS